MSVPAPASITIRQKLTFDFFVLILILFSLCFAILLPGCGSSSSSSGTVATIAVVPTLSSVAVNRQQAFTATALDSSGNMVAGRTFTWSSSAPTVASVAGTGVATGLAPGSTQITATTGSVTSSAVTLNVTPVIASVTISPITATIKVGGTQQYTATATDVSGNTVPATFSFQNSNSSAASISSTGLVTGLTPGTVMITASAGNVTSPVATLTVTP